MFHVPELARLPLDRRHPLYSDRTFGNNGAFELPSPEPGWRLSVIAGDGGGWDHVSAKAIRSSGAARVPTWKEMSYLKELFWDAEDVVMQLHPARSAYVNCHPAVLHLWRPQTAAIPVPPVEMV